MDAVASGDFFTRRNARSVRRSRVVLAPRPWRLSGPPVRAWQRWQQTPLTGESTYKPTNIARGKPAWSASPVVLCPCAPACGMPVCFGARDLRVHSAPGFPCALWSQRDNETAKPGRISAAGRSLAS